MKANFKYLAVAVSILMVQIGCSTKDLGAGLSIQLAPNTAVLVPGSGSSCLDISTAAIADAAGTPTPVGTSVSPLRLVYPNLTLSWSSTDLFYIAYIQADIVSSNITGGAFSVQLTNTDFEPMFALNPGSPFNVSSGTSIPLTPPTSGVPTTIGTQGPGRTAVFPACTFTFGGIALNNTQQSFQAPVQITIVGYAIDPQFNERSVQKSFQAEMQYVGTQNP